MTGVPYRSLGQLAQGRDNNFNLIRFLAALSVLYSHSYAIVLGPNNHEPFVTWIGYTLAGIAVDVFFVTSGFLVAGSLLRLDDFKAFFRARALRIFPALIVMSALLAFVLGPAITTLAGAEYFSRFEVYKFFVKNATILTGVKYKLPGVFDGLPFGEVINGSLWTLPFELRCYILLALVWWAVSRFTKSRLKTFTVVSVLFTAAMLAMFVVTHHVGYKHWHTFRLFYFFFCGVAFYLLRHRIRMTHTIALVLGSCLLVFGILRPAGFFHVYPLVAGYLILYFAYVPGGRIRLFNRLGDYSYGIYIYAFPIQQLLLATVPGITPAAMIIAAIACTLPLAVLSWHVIEKPALARKPGSGTLHPSIATTDR